MTLQELEAMRKVDVTKAEKESLVDIREITVDKELPVEERIRDFMDKVKNPYCFRVGSVAVKVAFTKDGGSFEERFEKMLAGLKL